MFVRSETGRYNPDGSLRFRYVCDVKYRKKGDCKDSKNVKGYEIDNFVIEQICAMSLGENEFYKELLNTKNTLMLKIQETEKELNELRKRLMQIENDIQNQIANLRTAPEGVKKAIYSDIEALGKEQEEKQAWINAIYEELESQDIQVADIEKAVQMIMDFPRLVELVGYEGKLQLFRRIIECVIIDKYDKVHIFLKGSNSNDFFRNELENSDMCHTEQNSILYTPCDVCS